MNHSDKVRFKKKLKNLGMSLWHHLGFKYIDALTVNNREHLHKLNVSPQFFVPNGMNTNYEPFSWPKPYCAWISNLKQIKRPELYVKLAEEFKDSGVDFLMVGKMMKQQYQWIEDKQNIPDNLHFLGFKSPEEVNGILRSSLLHIHTCYPEGFPNVFIQAWIQQKPSVSLGYDPNGYLESKNMGYHAEENWEMFVSYVSELIQDQDIRKKMGENAFNFSINMFSTEKMVHKLEILMDALVSHETGKLQSLELL
jgi:glycosyltransferase involved in cell wall biosynthesis